MGVWLNGFWTIIAVAASTAATAGVLFKMTKYLMNDHDNTAKRNELKTKAKSIKQILKSVYSEFAHYKLKLGGDNLDDSLSTHSGSTMVLTEKSFLELEEGLIRLLERLDSLNVQTFSSEISALAGSEQQIDSLRKLASTIIINKKDLIKDIQMGMKELDLIKSAGLNKA
jgi:hypothetical protein